DPCACGGRRTYAACCAGAADGTRRPATDVAWDRWLAEGAPGLARRDLARLPLPHLARIDASRAAAACLNPLRHRLGLHHHTDLATRAIDAARRHPAWSDELEDSWRTLNIQMAMLSRQFELARAELDKLRDATRAATFVAALAVHERRPEALSRLAFAAMKALDSPQVLADLAWALVPAPPALAALL